MTRLADDFAAIRGCVRSPIAASENPVQRLADRWEAAKQNYYDTPAGDQDACDAAYQAQVAVEAEILALPTSGLLGVALKLRVLAEWMSIEQGECANYDGVRTNSLYFDEQMLASALADLDRLAKGAA